MMSHNGLTKLAEECGELTQVAAKAIALGHIGEHWDGTDLKVRLEEEIADAMAAAIFVTHINGLDVEHIIERTAHKRKLFSEWHEAP